MAASSAATQITPPAMRARICPSGPTPSGNSITASTKNKAAIVAAPPCAKAGAAANTINAAATATDNRRFNMLSSLHRHARRQVLPTRDEPFLRSVG